MIDLSVIIPVYKVEATLDRCVSSVIQQNVPRMEIILVDDGSPDRCGIMCDAWKERDSRITVIHKKNGGLSSARNAGIELATGQYITFVDSDDYLLPDKLKVVMEILSNYQDPDILEFGLVKEPAEQDCLELSDCKYNKAKDYWLETRAWNHSYACNKLFKKHLFDRIRFAEGRIFEDLLLLPQLLTLSPRVVTTHEKCYVYTENNEGISKHISRTSVYNLLRAEMKAAWVMKTMPWNKNGRNLYYMMLCRIYDLIRSSK